MTNSDHILRKVNPALTIWLPLSIVVISMIVLFIFVVMSGNDIGSWEQWSNIAIIILVSIFFVTATLELIILIVIIVITNRASSKIQPLFVKTAQFTQNSQIRLSTISNSSVQSLIRIQQINAGIKNVLRGLFFIIKQKMKR